MSSTYTTTNPQWEYKVIYGSVEKYQAYAYNNPSSDTLEYGINELVKKGFDLIETGPMPVATPTSHYAVPYLYAIMIKRQP